jgi:parvulin-like peptidyl-prolyl isomerase
MRTLCIFSVLFLGFTVSVCFAAESDVVAEVNGAKITVKDLNDNYNEQVYFVSDKGITREGTLSELINRELGLERARKGNLDRDPIVQKKRDDVLYHAQISKDLEPEFKKITVSDADVSKYYSENPEYRTAHILVRLPALPSDAQVVAAEKSAKEAYDILKKSPDKFHFYANKFNEGLMATNGGDLGFLPRVRMAREYYAAIKGKAAGTILPPVRTQYGFHVIRVMAVRDFKDIDKNLYKKIVYDMKRDEMIANYFASLRKNATVKINQNLLK